MKGKKIIISIMLCVSIVFGGLFFADVPKANAVPLEISNLVANIAQFIGKLGGTIGAVGQWVIDIWQKAKAIADAIAEAIGANLIVVAKVAALYAVQEAVALIVGDSDGQANIIRDFEQYLYSNTKQLALDQVDDFFIATSGGRLSSFHYEGIGRNYDAYLVGLGKDMLGSSADDFKTTIQDAVQDPVKDMFADKNMKGLMSYMSCANNVACYTLASVSKYKDEITKEKDIAQTEQNDGILAVKDALGRITKPAEMVKSMLGDIDKQGTQMIITAEADTLDDQSAALQQIAEGAIMAIAARAINFGIEDQEGQIIAASSGGSGSGGSPSYAFSLTYAAIAPAMASPH